MATFNVEMISGALKRKTQFTAVIPIERMDSPGQSSPGSTGPFKTIYLLHGFSGSHHDWLNSTRIEYLARMYDVAVIMPSCENSFYIDDETTCQFYEKFISEELVDFTRKAFRLSDKREDTTIAGLSMGGYGALRDGMRNSNVFGSIFALSSALITDEIAGMKEGGSNAVAPYSYYRHVFGDLDHLLGSDNDPKAVAEKMAGGKAPVPKIFICCGTEDMLITSNRDIHSHLAKLGVQHEYREAPGIHNWAFWDEYIEKAMEWLYGKPGK